MTSNAWFDPIRFCRLAQHDANQFGRIAGLIAALGAALLALGALIAAGSAAPINYSHGVFGPFFFLSGWMVSAGVFSGLHDTGRASRFLTLPASSFEKTLSRLLLTAFVYSVLTLLLFWAFSYGASIVSWAVRQRSLSVFDPFSRPILNALRGYIISSSLFFCGGTIFRSHPFVKTFMTLILLALMIMALTCIGGLATQGAFESRVVITPESLERFFASLTGAARIFLYWILAPLCWGIAWLRVARVQV